MQAKPPQHPNTNYAQGYQLRFDIRIELDKGESKVAKFKEIFKKIIDDKLLVVLYPYSTSPSVTHISVIARIPNTYTDLKRYLPGLKPPLKNNDIVYGQKYLGTNTAFND